MKTLKITQDAHNDLMMFKARWQCKTFEEVIKLLMDYYELYSNDQIRK